MLALENIAASIIALFIIFTASYIVVKICFFALDCVWAVIAFAFMVLVHPISIVIEVLVFLYWYLT